MKRPLKDALEIKLYILQRKKEGIIFKRFSRCYITNIKVNGSLVEGL